MKKLFAVVVVFGLVVGFAGCGTEDDPTLGIDNVAPDTEEILVNKQCQVVNNKLTGYCLSLYACSGAPTYTPAFCPVGAAPKQVGTSSACPTPFDLKRACQ